MASEYPRLCGGTFFTLLLQALKQRKKARQHIAGEHDNLSEVDVLLGLIRVAYPEYLKPEESTFKTNTSDFKKCKKSRGIYLPFCDVSVIETFDIRVKNEYYKPLGAMSAFVDNFLESGTSLGKDIRLVKALIELITADDSIEDQQLFLIYPDGEPAKKNEIVELSLISLPAFLLGIWHFILVNRKENSVGAKTILSWHIPPQVPHGMAIFIGPNGASIGRNIEIKSIGGQPIEAIATDLTIHSLSDSSVDKGPSQIEKSKIKKYLNNAKNKYSTIKTLLYNDEPKPFYDFYVCNDIERRIPITGAGGAAHRIVNLENVTIQSLSQYHRFVILSGTGGLGKSMMMRHLLLDTIEKYDELSIIPIFIPLKDFDEMLYSLIEYIHSKVRSLFGEVTQEQFESLLIYGKCLLLFDGLDEVSSVNVKQVDREIENFTDRYPKNVYIISSRPYQSFISYSRFTVLQLKPFTKNQALRLIDNLEFRLDEPTVKEKFRRELVAKLFFTHRAFIENPLLLTIMLLTFEQYAEVPSKMHLFYREAFAALAVKHDASKGAYKRTLKTELSAEKFADYFAEMCSRTYYDVKFELSRDEFEKYFYELNERIRSNDKSVTASDFLFDLCSNLCLMYYESGKYRFTHRSFQEYFCALYFSKQKDRNLKSIGDFFENQQTRIRGDKTLHMLYDMIPDKVEEYIFLPYLNELFSKCDQKDGYWTFLKTLYPIIEYDKGDTLVDINNEPNSFIYNFIKDKICNDIIDFNNFPHCKQFVVDEYIIVFGDNDDSDALTSRSDFRWSYFQEYEYSDAVGWLYCFNVEDVLSQPKKYGELKTCLSDDKFYLKDEYTKIREYMNKLKEKQKPTGSSLFDLF